MQDAVCTNGANLNALDEAAVAAAEAVATDAAPGGGGVVINRNFACCLFARTPSLRSIDQNMPVCVVRLWECCLSASGLKLFFPRHVELWNPALLMSESVQVRSRRQPRRLESEWALLCSSEPKPAV